MFRALLGKEWKQLRALRWVGLGLGILIPPFLIAAADAAQRGWLPFGSVGSYSVAELLRTAMPALLIGLWVLLALLIAAQSFAGDRAAGTEQFLLERPVPRARTWLARLLAALGSLVVLYLCHMAYWAGLTRLVVAPSTEQWGEALLVLAGGGAAALVVAFVAGVAAATLLPIPIPAVLLGLVLFFIPGLLAAVLGGRFPFAAVFAVPVGAVLPWFLLAAYLLASHRMHCRGEPAGRGRLRRGLLVLGVSLLLVPLLFLVLAPISVRAGAARLGWPALAVPHGEKVKSISLINQTWPGNPGWLVDVERAKKLRFLPPPVDGTAWTDDGERVAVVHSAGALGGIESRTKLDIFTADGERVGETLVLDEADGWLKQIIWHDQNLLLAVADAGSGASSAIIILNPGNGAKRRVPVAAHAYQWELIGPDDEGTFYVFRMLEPGPPPRHGLYRLDLERGELDPEPLLEEGADPVFRGKQISPSGRYWLRYEGEPPVRNVRITDLESGEPRSYPHCSRGRWLAGDRFVCLEVVPGATRLTVGRPDEALEEILSRPDSIIIFEIASDGRKILAQVWKDGTDEEAGFVVWNQGQFWRTGAELREVLILEPGGGPPVDVGRRIDLGKQSPGFQLRWIGSDRLAVSARGRLAFMEIEGDGEPRYVFGSP